MSQISKCPNVTVVLTYWEASRDVSELSYKSLLYSTSVGSYCKTCMVSTMSVMMADRSSCSPGSTDKSNKRIRSLTKRYVITVIVNIARNRLRDLDLATLVANLATRWRHLHYCKYGHQMAPLALVTNLVTRWRHVH